MLIGRLRPGRWESTVETTDAGWADHPMISTEQCPRLSIERRKHHAVRQRGGISFRFTSQRDLLYRTGITELVSGSVPMTREQTAVRTYPTSWIGHGLRLITQ